MSPPLLSSPKTAFSEAVSFFEALAEASAFILAAALAAAAAPGLFLGAMVEAKHESTNNGLTAVLEKLSQNKLACVPATTTTSTENGAATTQKTKT